jgi:hypothetical protein
MRVTKQAKPSQVRTEQKAARSEKYFDTIGPRKTCYLMRQFNHISDKADLFSKNQQ